MKLVLAAAAAAAAAAVATAPAAAQPMGATPGASTEAAKTAEGVGQIKSVDAKTESVTLHHSPIASLGWPAMTMTFKATPEALEAAKAAKAGQTVKFTLQTPDNLIVAIQPQ